MARKGTRSCVRLESNSILMAQTEYGVTQELHASGKDWSANS